MSELTRIFVSAIVIGLAVCQAPTPTPIPAPVPVDAPVANCDNAFINGFKNSQFQKVKDLVLKNPLTGTNFEICSAEWNVYGTCCDPAKVKDAAKDKMDRWAARTMNFVGKLNKMENFAKKRVAQIRERIERINERISKNPERINATKNAVDKAKQLAMHADRFVSLFEGDNYDKAKKQFFAEYKECFDKVKDFRMNTVCLTCSGRAAKFMDGNAKLKIGERACTEIVKSCSASWNFIYSTTQTFRAIRNMRRIWNSDKDNKNGQSTVTVDAVATVGADTSAEAGEIIDSLKTISTIDKKGVVFNPDVQRICNKLLTVESMSDEITGDEALTEATGKDLEEEEKDDAKMDAKEKEEVEKRVKDIQRRISERAEKCKKDVAELNTRSVTEIAKVQVEITKFEAEVLKTKTEVEEAKKITDIKLREDKLRESAKKIADNYKGLKNENEKIIREGAKVYEKCSEFVTDEVKKRFADYFQKFAEQRAKAQAERDAVNTEVKESFNKILNEFKTKIGAEKVIADGLIK
jgi:hypothetical protein